MPFWPFWRTGRRKRPPSRSAQGNPGAGLVSDDQRRSATMPNSVTSGAPTTAAGAGPHGIQRKLSWRNSNRRTNTLRRRTSTKDSATFEKRLGEKTGSDLSRMDTAGSSDADTSLQRRRRSDELTALPVLKEIGTSPHLRPINRDHQAAAVPYDFHLDRNRSFSPSPSPTNLPSTMPHGPGSKMQRMGSNKRSATGPPVVGRKLSKRRKDEKAREEEIRAMSQPHQPLGRQPSKAGSLLRKDSRKQKSGLTRHFSDRPTSNISLPFAESIHSSMSSDSGNNAVALSALHVFAPRPSIRLSSGQSSYGLSRSKWAPVPEESTPPRLQWRSQSVPMATDAVLTASRTIDTLADNLDASALRDLMERDSRRKEKRRKQQEQRLQEKLERRAERQRLREQREQELAEGGVPGGPDYAGPSSGRRDDGLGIVTGAAPVEAAQVVSPIDIEREYPIGLERLQTPVPSLTLSTGRDSRPSDEYTKYLHQAPVRQAGRHEVSSIETPLETPLEETAQAIHFSPSTASKPIRAGPALSPPDSPNALVRNEDSPPPLPSKSLDRPLAPVEEGSPLHPSDSSPSERKASTSTAPRNPSDADPRFRRRGSGWTAFFRRGTSLARRMSTSKHSTSSEASFSNTSRESMSRQPIPAHLQAQPVRQRSTNYRSQSKFREDLPEMELPISPPDSRVQSPDVTAARIAAARKVYPNINFEAGRSSASPAFDDRSARSISPIAASAALMSASLASIDSEGSWLSGRPSKRIPRNGRPHQNSIGSTTSYPRQAEPGAFNGSYEELGIPDEEYFQRLTPRAAEPVAIPVTNEAIVRKISAGGRGLRNLAAGRVATTTDEVPDDIDALSEGAVVHSGMERQPTVVHRSATHVKSREGLLNEFAMGDATPRNSYIDDQQARHHATALESDNEDEADLDDEWQPTPDEFRYQRAKSVDFGKGLGHVRHLSAGSAKLLDIPPSRRNSEREPTPSPRVEQMSGNSRSRLGLEAVEGE